MKKMNKLVALLLAAVMVLGLMPSMTVHAHAHTHAVEVNGIEEYPSIEADTETAVTITEAGQVAYFTFTPEVTDLYYFHSSGTADTKGYIYDANMEILNYNDDSNFGITLEIYSPNFCMEQIMEAGQTYVLSAQPYSGYWTGEFTVTVMTGHSYTSEVTKEATCDEDGVMTYTCTYCGETYDEAIPAAHTYSEETGKCIYCDEQYLITGECGESLTWELDYFGKLTIKGTGEMTNYSHSWSDMNYAPWYDYTEDLTALVIEEGVTSIGNYAFKDCQYITEVTLPETLTALGVRAFDACYGITEIVLPDAITEIPESCFYYCGALSKVTWPASLTKVGANAFYSCDLSDLVVPEGVTSIGEYAFGGNSNMTKLTLPSTLTNLDNYSLSSMYSVKDFIFTGDAPTFGGNYVFSRVTANAWYPNGNETWTEEVRQNYGGTITWKAICSGAHTYGEAVTVPATCTVGEYMTMTCTVCGYTEVSPETAPALGHDYQYSHYDGGCYEYSYDLTTCSRCDYERTANMVWNDHAYEATVVEATCTEGGYTVFTCSSCGTSYNDNYTAAAGHSVENWSEATEATCTEDGIRTGSCANCGETATEVVTPALGHEWDEENGVANDDGSMTYSCIRCDATYTTEGSSLHLGDNQFTIAANSGRETKTFTAEQSGTLTITLSNAVYHNNWAWDNGWTDEYWQPLGLQWVFDQGFFNVYLNDIVSDYIVVSESEIILDTVEVKAGDLVTVEVNHPEYSDYHNNDVQFNMNLALEAAAEHQHTPAEAVRENEKAATCTEAGSYDSVVYCAECGEEISRETVTVDALGHTEAEAVRENEVEPTCTVAGSYESVVCCSECGEEISRETVTVDALGHDYVAEFVEPTCEKSGYTLYTCSRCGHSYKDDPVEPEHKWNEGVVTAPTCTEKGYTTYTCTVCALEYVDEASWTDALGHDFVNGDCTRCDAVMDATFIDVPVGSFFFDPVEWAVEKGITNGATDTTFNPNGDLQRAQVVVMLWRAAGEPAPASTENPFTDVAETDFFYEAVLWAVENNITTGTSATTFTPYGVTNRAQAVTFLWRYLGQPESTATNDFTDVVAGMWYEAPINWAVENNVTNGMGDGTFGIDNPCNRAHMVTFLFRALAN